jgi:hypothetical protein
MIGARQRRRAPGGARHRRRTRLRLVLHSTITRVRFPALAELAGRGLYIAADVLIGMLAASAQKTYKAQARLVEKQSALVSDDVLDDATLTFANDHVFDSWTAAAHVVSGKGSYAGSYHWQRLTGDPIQD